MSDMKVTKLAADHLLRLPLWIGLEDKQQRVIDAVLSYDRLR